MKSRASKAKLAQPSSEAMSAQLARRVQKLRRERHWSLDMLSAACGVSRSLLSEIERDKVNPTLQVIYSIARAFGMTIGELVEAPGASSSLSVVRADDASYLYRSDKDCEIRTLSPLHLEKDVELYQVRLKGHGALRSAAHYAGTREFLTVQAGRLQVESGEMKETLGPGDSVSYRADVPHAITNLGSREASFFLVDIYRQSF